MTDYWNKEILVLGCGNILFGDDGFGVAVAEHLQDNFDLPGNVHVINAGLGVRNLLFTLVLSEKRPQKIIIVDAIDAGRPPGEIFELDISEIPEVKIDDFSMHQLPTSNLLRELQDLCGVEVKIVSAQVQSIPEEVSPGLSAVMENSIPVACQKVLKLATKPVLGITMGDPAGVGPEVTVTVFDEGRLFELCKPLVIGDAEVMRRARDFVHSRIAVRPIHRVAEAGFRAGTMEVLDLRNVDLHRLEMGKVSAMAGHAAFESIVKAIELALAGDIDGIVTNPIHKQALHLAGHHFAGHTEILGHYTQTKEVGMLLAFENLRVIHVSSHVPLRQACDLVKKDRIVKVIRMLHEACQQFGIASPRIGVAGLNPHASDGGLFGDEEADEIIPAIEAAREMGYVVEGPIPPDTLFPKAKAGVYDGCVAMYHDQGHIAFKLETFQWDNKMQRVKSVRGVNITLGLPIIRTSVDHGTAFDIAGKGIASAETLMDAITYAAKMAGHRQK